MKITVSVRKEQLDLSLASQPMPRRRAVRPCSRERAAWWFDQMRRVLEEPGKATAGRG